ncbi:hypothetical protein ES319_A03G018500v1 [Gossypium barbadense]|uniref:DUF4408 domain-containing protein n=2 Tax=Gossypium TaxID=3633 RepID=A0A5J5WBX4_GOSBA|nr:hypothetical protein ES319_A03G018500v1 [Gossypium barbadense]TYH23531.1 hypothetical protein ES288_A03G020700v1 [Gossypium darwinii]
MKLFCSCLILFVVSLLLLRSLSTRNLEFLHNPVSLFVLFNAMLISVTFASQKQSTNEVDGEFTYLGSSCEVGASFDDTQQCGDMVDVCRDDTGCSDGYYEDDDSDSDDNDDHDDGWFAEGEYSDDLQRRIEDFIAKVNNGWREELLNEKDDSITEWSESS